MARLLAALGLLIGSALVLWPGAACAVTLTTYTSQASYAAALPATGLTSTVESFSGIAANANVSTTTPQSWAGFTLLAKGTSPWGQSQYCLSLSACLNWTASPPNAPGIYAAVADPTSGDGSLVFTPAARTFAFGVDYWDWNDGGQRSIISVVCSDGTTFTVTGPTTVSGDPGGFVGFRLDSASVYAGIYISTVTWKPNGANAEIIGLKNVRISVAQPVVSVAKSSRIWDPGGAHNKAIPGNEAFYTIAVSNTGLAATDQDTLLVVDALPSQLSFWNGDIDSGGTETYATVAPIGFSQANGSTMTFTPSTDFGVSTSSTAPTSFAQCSPIAMDGTFSSSVKFICIRPRGQLLAGSSAPQVTFVFRARIN